MLALLLRRYKKLDRAAAKKMRLSALAGFFLGTYVFFCPLYNEPLYQFLSTHPSKEEIDLLSPVVMGKFSGEHKFFPVLNTKGKQLQLHGVYFKAAVQPPRGLMIMNPGNAFCVSHMLGCKPALTILEMGYDLFMYDYEGYGESQGTANYRNFGNDGVSACRYVRDELKPKKLILYGMSMGSGVSTHVAARESVDGLILDSPFISPEHTVKEWIPLFHLYPSAMFPEPRYDNRAYLSSPHVPTLIIAKGHDIVCSAAQGKALRLAATQPTEFVLLPKSEHLYVSVPDEAAYKEALQKFLAK